MKGIYDYDYENNILLFKRKNGSYDHSRDYDGFIIDLDIDKSIRGIQLFDASKMLRISKTALKNIIQFEFFIETKENLLSVQLRFKTEERNKFALHYYQDFIRESEQELVTGKIIRST